MNSEGTPLEKKIEFIIFGGTGDLSRKKLLPALNKLYKEINLKKVLILGRNEEKFRNIKKNLPEDFAKNLGFIKFHIEDTEKFRELIKSISKDTLKIFYIALPPNLFSVVLENIGRFLNVKDKRIVIEKPYGLSLKDARNLNEIVRKYFTEEEIFRIDHFLGKIQVQNILSFKFSNLLFSQILNACFIDKVEILMLENIGVEGRKTYYNQVGAIKDMLQNHLLMLTALVALDTPADIKDFHNEIKRILKRIRFSTEDFYITKYESYTGNVETFVAVKLLIEKEEWKGVPFLIATGKKLKEKISRICIHFKKPVDSLEKLLVCVPDRNILIFDIFPENTVRLKVNFISPLGFLKCSESVEWRISLREIVGKLIDPYQSLLIDIIKGDRTLFLDDKEVEILWEKTESLIEVVQGKPVEVYKDRSEFPEKVKSWFECINN